MNESLSDFVGRLLIIKKCENIWCSISTEDYSGWVKAENIWGSIK